MNERSTSYLCLLAGFVSATIAWTLVASAPLAWTSGTLFLLGLVTIILVRQAPPKRGRAAMQIWAGVLLGGLVQLGYQILRFPQSADGFVFDLTLTLAVVAFVAILTTGGYLLGSIFIRRKKAVGT